MWISGPLTTVHHERICRELAAVGRIGVLSTRWVSDKIRSAAVVLGHHPIRAREMGAQAAEAEGSIVSV
jgi:hypothetical protein